MKKRFFLIFILFLSFSLKAQAFELPEKISLPGRMEGRGKYFQIKDSQYLNIILESKEEIKIVLESIPRMIVLDIESASSSSSTQLTISGLEANKTYYKYQDSYQDGLLFISDQNGLFSWEQDLSQPHHIWIQETKGTIFLPENCLPPIGIWDASSSICTLTKDLNESVEIRENAITLDCADHNIKGLNNSGYGIYIGSLKEKVAIKNCNISDFSIGIYLSGVSHIHLFNNNILNNESGIIIGSYFNFFPKEIELVKNSISKNLTWGISGNGLSIRLEENNISGNLHGLFLNGLTKQEFIGNVISDNLGIAFNLEPSSNSFLRDNLMTNNKYNFQIMGGDNPNSYYHDIDTSNKINGKPIYYLIEEKDKIIDSSWEVGYLGLINSENITVRDLTLTNNGQGILLVGAKNSKIEKVRLLKNRFGLFLIHSSNNQIEENEIIEEGPLGIGNWGLILSNESSNNILRGNNISKSWYGIAIYYSSNDNQIYHNNFRDHVQSAYVFRSSNNLFDNGYLSGGNYWSDYLGSDIDGDGIGDNPYCFQGGCDRYPFLKENGWERKPRVLISEVYYDVREDKGREGDNEWIILNNLEKEEIDLSGWKICSKNNEGERCHQLLGKIPAGYLALLTPTSTTFDFWKVPKEMARIVLGKKFGSYGLNNEGDNILLKNEEGKIIDAMSYGNDNLIFDPPCQRVKEGNSLLRFPPDKDTDTAQDFIESEPTIGKNRAPIPFIIFSPLYPVKRIEVKFNASSSTDPDGEIVNFEWQIKNASTSEILATSSATTTSLIFQENGQYEITLIVTDNDGATSSTSTILKVEPFSFAIITDLHIGWGIPDYNSKGYDPSNEHSSQGTFNSQDYYITQRLEKAIDWINKNYKKENIKFVVVLGDISDTAEYSEFLKAREILNKLEIPYLPIIGNHDIWPYTQKMTADPDNRLFSIKERAKDGELLGDTYFETVFWGSANATNTQRIKTLFDYFERQEDLPQYQGPPYFSNYAFSYGGIKFVALDFAPRNFIKLILTPFSSNNPESLDWFEKELKKCNGIKTVVFTHYPFLKEGGFFDIDPIKDYIRNSRCEVLNFAGHTHINAITIIENKNKVIETEPASQTQLSNPFRPPYALTGEFIRLVQITGERINEINYETLINGFPPVINPYITVNKEEIAVGKKIKFLAHTKNLKAKDIFSYEWDFDKNYSAQCVRPENKTSYCEVIYNQPGTYKVSLNVIPNSNKDYSESLYWYLNVKEKPKPEYKISSLPLGIHAFLEGEKLFDLTLEENAQSTEATALLGKEKSPFTPIGALKVHFEKATEDIDFSNLIADTDLDKKKTILYISQWSDVIEQEKILFIPK